MRNPTQPKSPRRRRYLIWFLSALLTLLCFWLLGFVVHDIGNRPGPDYGRIEKQYVDQALLDQLDQLRQETASLETQIKNQREVQQILQQSTEESKATMDQLIALHRLNIEQQVKPSSAEQQALAESEKLFLGKQQEFQAANEQIAHLSERLRTASAQIKTLERRKDAQSAPAKEAYAQQRRSHRIRVAALKLAVVVPVLLIAAGVVMKWRGSAYLSILVALLVASFWRVGVVMHAYFPQEWFRYIAVGAGIAVVLTFLVQLIRAATAPGRERLLRQYRESYYRGRCPGCSHPFRGGPLDPFALQSRLASGHGASDKHERSRPCICPACGERLFEPCEKCDAIRHSLLPFCEHCGDARVIPLEPGG